MRVKKVNSRIQATNIYIYIYIDNKTTKLQTEQTGQNTITVCSHRLLFTQIALKDDEQSKDAS